MAVEHEVFAVMSWFMETVKQDREGNRTVGKKKRRGGERPS